MDYEDKARELASGIIDSADTYCYLPSIVPFETREDADEALRWWRSCMTSVIAQAMTEAHEAGRRQGMEDAAKIARETSTFEWRGGEEWAAGYVDGKNAAAAAIESKAKEGE